MPPLQPPDAEQVLAFFEVQERMADLPLGIVIEDVNLILGVSVWLTDKLTVGAWVGTGADVVVGVTVCTGWIVGFSIATFTESDIVSPPKLNGHEATKVCKP